MGFKYESPRIRVAFEQGHDFHGFEATLRKLTLGEFLDITGIGEVDGVSIAHQLSRMGDKLLGWNLEDAQGQPIPATSQSVLEQDKDLMVAVLAAWLDAINGVKAPLAQSSPATAPSLEASIPMDVPSESLAS